MLQPLKAGRPSSPTESERYRPFFFCALDGSIHDLLADAADRGAERAVHGRARADAVDEVRDRVRGLGFVGGNLTALGAIFRLNSNSRFVVVAADGAFATY